MNGYSEFFYEDGNLLIHVEYYGGTVRHYFDYIVDGNETSELINKLGLKGGTDLVKFLTAKFSQGNGVLEFLKENGAEGKVSGKGYEDASSDV